MQTVKLTCRRITEEHGVQVHHEPGDVIMVGRQTAERWLASGKAVEVDEAIPEVPEPRVNVAGRYRNVTRRARRKAT